MPSRAPSRTAIVAAVVLAGVAQVHIFKRPAETADGRAIQGQHTAALDGAVGGLAVVERVRARAARAVSIGDCPARVLHGRYGGAEQPGDLAALGFGELTN